MRLICPSCSAQYEVDDSVIPETGRDVQCSNCGHTWYQLPASRDRDLAPDQQAGDEPDENVQEHGGEETYSSAEAISDIVAAEEDPNAEFYEEIIEEETVIGIITPGASLPANDEDENENDTEGELAEAEEPPLPEREVDPSVLSILRSEAEEEMRQRQQEREEQADTAIGAIGEITRESEALARGAEPEEDENSASRRDLLPDIEEINSTLQADTTPEIDTQDDAAAIELLKKRRLRGWRLGFSLVIILLAIALILYAYADLIGARFPGLKPALAAYVEQVNALRFWVNDLMEKATAMLTDKVSPPQE